MTMQLLRRITGLQPAAVTTAPAPVIGQAIDVPAAEKAAAPAASAPWPRPEPQAPRTHHDVTETDLPRQPTVVLPGTCWHDLHVDIAGDRVGLTISDDGTWATLLRCPFTGPAGV